MTPMNTYDISKTPLVQRYGVRGARFFVRIWFPFMYVLLICISAGLWINYSSSPSTDLQILIVTLLVVAAYLLTRMWIKYVTAIERLESRRGMESTDHGRLS